MSEFSERRIADLEARLSAAEQERDQANACIDALEEALFDVATFNRETGALIGRSRDDLETRVEALRAAEARAEAAEGLLRAISEWDALNLPPDPLNGVTGDAPYWKRQITKVLAGREGPGGG